MEFRAGPRLVDGPNKAPVAEGFDNYLKSSWQPAPSNFSDPANPFLSRQDTGCSQAIADTATQLPKTRTQKIKDALQSIRFKDPCVLIQFWSPDQPLGRGCVLRTLNQPFQLTDLSDDLCSYRVASLDHEFYVDLESDVGIGLIGRVFLNGSPEWTPNVQNYSRKEYPQIDDAVRCNIRGSFAMPVFEDNGPLCLGVLEIVMTIEKESFDCEFREICAALQGVNLKSSELLFSPTKELTRQSKPVVKSDAVFQPKRKPKTKTSGITHEHLRRLFDKPRAIAAAELKICKSTFRNICRQLKIDEWPYKKRTRGCCNVGEYKKVILEETEVSGLTSLSALDDKVMEDSSTVTGEDESGAVILDDQFPKEVFESNFLAELDATIMEDLGDNIITTNEYETEVMDDQSYQAFWAGLGNSLELDEDYLLRFLR